MGIDRNAPYLPSETAGLAPIGLVAWARRRIEPTVEQPRLELPLPPPREPAPRVVPQDDETRERSPTRGVNVFDMV